MKRVFKYPLKITDEQDLQLPAGATILSVAEQRGGIVLYALVDTTATETWTRRIYIHGTGHVVYADYLTYIGTVNLDNGNLMFHVFLGAAECPGKEG